MTIYWDMVEEIHLGGTENSKTLYKAATGLNRHPNSEYLAKSLCFCLWYSSDYTANKTCKTWYAQNAERKKERRREREKEKERILFAFVLPKSLFFCLAGFTMFSKQNYLEIF